MKKDIGQDSVDPFHTQSWPIFMKLETIAWILNFPCAPTVGIEMTESRILFGEVTLESREYVKFA